jgi:hypothetical protein
MKTTIILLIALAFVIYSGDPIIKFKPFSISFQSPHMPFALFFLMLAIAFYGVHFDKKAYKRGFNDGYEFTINEFKKNTNHEN